MKLTFLVPGSRQPIGGVVALYELVNAMRRRRHDVTLVHIDFIGNPREPVFRLPKPVRSLDDVAWFSFEPGVTHLFPSPYDDEVLPVADVVFFFDERMPPDRGLPVALVQGLGTLSAVLEDRVWHVPCPKLCIARWLVDAGLQMGVPSNQLVHIPYGIDHSQFRLMTPIEGRSATVAMRYSSHPVKGAALGLAAIVAAKRRVPELDAVLFGTEQPPRDLPPWVTYLHAPSYEVLVRDVYNRARVFVWPSISEGFGFPPLEAMACGAALVTTANGGSDDFAEDGSTALVSQPRDTATMARHIVSLLQDDEARQEMARRGRKLVERFDWDVSGATLEGFLNAYRADPDKYRWVTSPS